MADRASAARGPAEAGLGGRFITLEGIEGVGKSTQVAAAADAAAALGHEVVRTREPGGTAVGDRIRDVLLDPAVEPAPETELLLMFAARAEHLERCVRPALAAGRWVVCDRFTDASYAYQGGGRGVSLARIAALETWLHDDLHPHLTLLLDAPVDTALARALGQGPSDRFERETRDFFERARATYLDRAEREPDRFRVIDATAPKDVVGAAVAAAVRALEPG